MKRHLIAMLACVALTDAAQATGYLFTLSGKVGGLTTTSTQPSGAGSVTRPIPTPPSIIAVGDAVAISLRFDTGLVQSSFPGAYNLIDADLEVAIGAYDGQFQAGDPPAVFFVSNDPPDPADAIFISDTRGLVNGTSPFAFGGEPVQFKVTFDAEDPTGTARDSNDITEEPPLSAYSQQTSTLQFFIAGPKATTVTDVELVGAQATLAAVPEPTTWASMVLGFMVIGAGMRRRSRCARVTKPEGSSFVPPHFGIEEPRCGRI